jgi:hypothetical protein
LLEQPVVTHHGLVKYSRNTDLVYTTTREVELAIWRRDDVAEDDTSAGRYGVGVVKVCVVGSNPMIRFGVRPVSTYQTMPSGVAAIP